MRLILGRRAVIIGLAASGHFPNCPALEGGSDAWLGFVGPPALISMPPGLSGGQPLHPIASWGGALPASE
jgi:hypothetical protein